MAAVLEEVKVVKIIKEPKASLTMFARYLTSTPKAKQTILLKCKYPGDYIPRYYDIARQLVCDLFGGNLDGEHEAYFAEFKRQAEVLRRQAAQHPDNTDNFKNRFYSAKALDGLVAMQFLLLPVLERYILNSNLKKRGSHIIRNEVRIGARAELLLSDPMGVSQTGFLAFNFASAPLKEKEAAARLHILHRYFKEQGHDLHPQNCLLADIPARRIYLFSAIPDVGGVIEQTTLEIKDLWKLI